MSTLLLRLAGPMQSYGCIAHFRERSTEREPTKSAVIGMLAAALGRQRDDAIDDLAALRFGVRVDREGKIIRDFQVSDPACDVKTVVSGRYYLMDAVFLVGLEGDEALLKNLEKALKSPVFQVYLGRKSCVPTLPIVIGIREESLLEALKKEPCMISEYMQKKGRMKGSVPMRLISDADIGDPDASGKKDLPVTFNPEQRIYAYRAVKEHADVIVKTKEHEQLANTDHDAMAELTEVV